MEILRLRCHSCGSTHAVLTLDMIPFITYSIGAFLNLMLSCLMPDGSIQKTERDTGVSFQLLCRFLRILREYKDKLVLFLRQQGLWEQADHPSEIQTLRFLIRRPPPWAQSAFFALIPKSRIDIGHSRVLPEDACRQIQAYKQQFPHITGKKIYEKLIMEGYLKEGVASLDTVYRYLKAADLARGSMPPKECLAFEFEHANDCWQADTTFGPVILCDGKRRQTYLIAFIDDASRLLVHGEFYFEDNAINMQKAFQKAILKFGLPRRIFVDNGCSYQNNQLNWICAELGIVKIHSKPYHPQGKAKIERSHRTEKNRWMNCTDWNEFHSLEDVNASYHHFLETEYNNGIHSSLGMSPRERYLKDFDTLKFVEKSVVEESFLHRITRKVTPTATVSLFNVSYSVNIFHWYRLQQSSCKKGLPFSRISLYDCHFPG